MRSVRVREIALAYYDDPWKPAGKYVLKEVLRRIKLTTAIIGYMSIFIMNVLLGSKYGVVFIYYSAPGLCRLPPRSVFVCSSVSMNYSYVPDNIS